MNEKQWDETASQLRKLETLLPNLPGLTEGSGPSTYLTTEQLTMGRHHWLRRMVRRGWRYGDDGQLHKGEGREHVSTPATGVDLPFRPPWDPKYNPRVDAPAVWRLGATFIGPNRYRYGMFLVDANAALREQDGCPECGAAPGDTLRIVHLENPNPFAPAWIKGWRWCRTCTDKV